MAYRGVWGLHMAVCGAQNTTDANSESRIAPARSFRYPCHATNHGVVSTLAGFMLSWESFGDFTLLVPQSFYDLGYSGP